MLHLENETETLNQLKCSSCGNYISVAPVRQTCVGYMCGRCFSFGDPVATAYETLAKKCYFPCRYDVYGCKTTPLFGDSVANHEKTCEYRLSVCPIAVHNCSWTDSAINSFQHCSQEHLEDVMENFKLEIDLHKPIVTNKIMKRGNEVFLLNLLYSLERGLAIVVKLFIGKVYIETLHYNLLLQSLDETKTTTLANREVHYCYYSSDSKTERIPYTFLSCLDKLKILASIEIEYNENANKDICILCHNQLPLYFLRCCKGHLFCKNCQDVNNRVCSLCNTNIRINSNYKLMKTEEANFSCCNAIFGCNFLGSADQLKKHERNACILKRCIVKGCNWKDFHQTDFYNHVFAAHEISPNKICIEEKNIEDGQTFFIWITAKCRTKLVDHTHKNALFVLQMMVNDAMGTVKIVANYVPFSGIMFEEGSMKVTLGITHNVFVSNIEVMTNIKLDSTKGVHICRSLFKQHKIMTVELVNCDIKCV